MKVDPLKTALRAARREEKKRDLAEMAAALGEAAVGKTAPEASQDAFKRATGRLKRKYGPQRRKRPRKMSSRKTLKDAVIRLLGLLDRKKNGPECRMIPFCPDKAPHHGTLAYHIVPAQRGDSTRFLPENVVWACSRANCGEVYNRSLYRQHHVDRFGKEYVERLEALAREHKQFTRTELAELRANLKAQVEAE